MSRINQTTFKDDGYKRIPCPNCGRFIGETHMGEKNSRWVKCPKCKNQKEVAHPRYGYKDEVRGIFWCEPSDSCWTACSE